MPNQLRLSIDPDSDGTCELFAEVSSGAFSGAGSAWFGLAELAKFGQSIRDTFPLAANDRLILEGGFWSKTGAPILQDIHVGIRAYPIGNTGSVGLRIQLATAVHNDQRADSRSSVQVELITKYEELKNFGQAIVSLTQDSQATAILTASDA